MRKALWIVVICGVAWAAIWVALTQLSAHAVRAWFEQQRAAGLVATHDGVRTTGFPHRFGVSVMQPHLEDAAIAIAWQAPRLDIGAAGYRPHHVVVTWPDEQNLRVAGWDAALVSEALSAEVTLQPLAGFAPGYGALTVRALEFDVAGLTSRLAALDLTLQQAAADPPRWDVLLDATALELPQPITMLPGNPPRRIEEVHVDAVLHADPPEDPALAVQAQRWAGRMDLRQTRLHWGEMELALHGDLTLARDGTMSGQLTLRARNWRQMLDMATSLGAFDADRAAFLGRALQSLDDGTEGEDTLEVPLTLADGQIRIGRIPIAPLPRLR